MFEAATEQIVKVSAPKVSILYKIILIVACVLSATTIPQMGLIGLILMIMFIFSTVLVFEYYSSEYEYSIVEDMLSVDRIMGKNIRRKGAAFDLSRATLVANVDSMEALRLSRKELRTYNYSSGVDHPDDIVIYTYESETNELVRLFIQANEETLNAIKENVPKASYKVDKRNESES